MDPEKVRRYRLHKQRLDFAATEDGEETLLELVRHLIAIQATDTITPYLSIYARMPGLKKEMLFDALNRHHTLVQLNAMRTTLFAVHTDLFPTISVATRKQILRTAIAGEKREMPAGIDLGELGQRVLQLLAVEDKTAAQIKRELGVSYNISWVLRRLMAEGQIIRAETTSWTSNIHRFALTSRLLPDINLSGLTTNEAIDRLLRMYINLFGPVSAEDMEWWSGLNKMEIVAALARIQQDNFMYQVNYRPVPWETTDYFMSVEDYNAYEQFEPDDRDIVTLLPYEDLFPKGYIERLWYCDATLARSVFSPYGEICPTIWLNGEIAGRWELKRSGTEFYALPELLKPVSLPVREMIAERCEAIERFLNEK